MPKWSKSADKFKVKVSYRKNKTGTIAIPAPILRALNNPAYIEFAAENGRITVREHLPAKSSTNLIANYSDKQGVTSEIKPAISEIPNFSEMSSTQRANYVEHHKTLSLK